MILTSEMWNAWIHRIHTLEHAVEHLKESQQIVSSLHELSEQLTKAEKSIMDTTIKAAIDEIAETKVLKDAVVAGFALTGEQIAALKQQVADLQAQIAAGNPVTVEDLAALGVAVADLDQVNKDTAAAVPQNT